MSMSDEKKKEWQIYRQALRDMPDKGCTDLDNPVGLSLVTLFKN